MKSQNVKLVVLVLVSHLAERFLVVYTQKSSFFCRTGFQVFNS